MNGIKNGDYIVTEAPFGALGDGKTNDRGAIQAAIDAAYEARPGIRFNWDKLVIVREDYELDLGDYEVAFSGTPKGKLAVE